MHAERTGRPDRPRRRRQAVVVAGPAVGAVAAALALTASSLAAPAAAAPTVGSDGSSRSLDAAESFLMEEYDLTAAEAEATLAEQDESIETAAALERRLGAKVLGSRIDTETGRLTVHVSDEAAARSVRAAGASAVVDTTTPVLERAQATVEGLMTSFDVEGASVGVDLAAGELALTVPAGATDPTTRRFVATVEALDAPVRVERTAAPAVPDQIYAGETLLISETTPWCTSGFNLRNGAGEHFMTTAGHCGDRNDWLMYDDDEFLNVGDTTTRRFPGDDYQLIEVEGAGLISDMRGAVIEFENGRAVSVAGAGNPPVGTMVCRTGITSLTECGTIDAYDVTVDYAAGRVTGLIQSGLCASQGDSGGPVYTAGARNVTAVGIHSGSTAGNCVGPENSFAQPVTEVLDNHNLDLVTE